MAKTWRDTRRDAIDEGRVNEGRVAAHRDRLEGEFVAYRLAEIRKAHGLSQCDVARVMGVTQSRVSRVERGDIRRAELATVAGYIRALGGELRVVARIDGQELNVR